MVAVVLLVIMLQAWSLSATSSADPVIPTSLDSKFKEFQKAVVAQQTQSQITALYGKLADYKNGFEQFKTTGVINAKAASGEVDSDFTQFQKFIKIFSRQYNNMDEFGIRYNLFQTVLKEFKGYNIGGDLVGINRLSDRTLSEKRAQYG